MESKSVDSRPMVATKPKFQPKLQKKTGENNVDIDNKLVDIIYLITCLITIE